MPHITLVGNFFNILPEKQPQDFYNDKAETLGSLSSKDEFSDVVIHCKNSQKVKANSIILSLASKMLKSIFNLGCDCFGFINLTFDLVCPDFSAKTVSYLLEILKTGSAVVDDCSVLLDLNIIIEHLKINIKINPAPLPGFNQPRSPLLTLSDAGRSSTSSFLSDETQQRSGHSSTSSSRQVKQEVAIEVASDDDLMEVSVEETAQPVAVSSTPLRCEPCGMTFNFTQAYERHMRKNHSPKTKQNVSVKLERTGNEEEDAAEVDVSAETSADSGNASVDLSEDNEDIADEESPKPRSPVRVKLAKNPRRSRKKSEDDDADWTNESSSSNKSSVSSSKSFTCPQCQAPTSSKCSHIGHVMFTHFRDRLKSQMGSPEGLCKICQRTLKGERSLANHLHSVHGLFSKELGFNDNEPANDAEGPVDPIQPSKRHHRLESQVTIPYVEPQPEPELETEPEVAKEVIFCCKHCAKESSSKKSILGHLARHLKKKILRKCSTSTENECWKCKIVFDDEDTLVKHVITEHKMGDKHVTEKLRSDAADNDDDDDVKPRRSASDSGSSNDSGKGSSKGSSSYSSIRGNKGSSSEGHQVPEKKEEVKGDDGTCSTCSQQFTSTKELVTHLAETHFKGAISKVFFGRDIGECQLCGKIMLDEPCLRQHLIFKHYEDVAQLVRKPENDSAKETPRSPRLSPVTKAQPAEQETQSTSASEEPQEFKVPPTPAPKRRGRPPKTPRQSLAEPEVPSSPGASNIPSTPMKVRSGIKVSSDPTDFTPAKRPRLSTNQTESVRKHESKVMRTPAKVDNLYRCHKCDLQTRDYSNLICHIGQIHLREKLKRLQGAAAFQCGICQDTLKSDVEFILHIAEEHRAIDLPSKENLRLPL